MTHLEAKLFSLLMVENYKQVIDTLYHILIGPVVAPQRGKPEALDLNRLNYQGEYGGADLYRQYDTC